MTIPHSGKKVKQKKRLQRKKVRSVSSAKQTHSRKKPQHKKKSGKKSQGKKASGNTSRKRIRELEAQVEQLKEQLKQTRRDAARKGWETRRRKLSEKRAAQVREIDTIEQVTFTKLTPEEIEFWDKPHVRSQVQDLYVQKIPEFFIEGEKWVLQKEPAILRRLIYAQVEGNFDEVAYELADEYGYEPNEIYSLWHGYKLPD